LAAGVTSAAQEDLMVHVRCQRQSVPTVVKSVKFPLSPRRADQYIAVTASQSTGNPGSNSFFVYRTLNRHT